MKKIFSSAAVALVLMSGIVVPAAKPNPAPDQYAPIVCRWMPFLCYSRW